MNWSNSWGDPPKDEYLEGITKRWGNVEIIPPPKPKTSEIMRQNNLLADEAIKQSQKSTFHYLTNDNAPKFNGHFVVQRFTIPETIEAIDKPDEVDCIVVGDLGIYEKYDAWNVLHIPTLLHFNRAVPYVEPTLEQLIDWCKLVQADHREDWEALKLLGTDIDKDATVELRQRILRHCQMIDIKI